MNPDIEDIDQLPEIKEAMLALAAVFVERIPSHLASMEKQLALIESDQSNTESWNTLHMLLHTIAGSAGSFGYAELGDRSRQLEHRISAALIATDPQQSSTSKQFHAEFNEEIRQFMQWISINVAPKDSP